MRFVAIVLLSVFGRSAFAATPSVCFNQEREYDNAVAETKRLGESYQRTLDRLAVALKNRESKLGIELGKVSTIEGQMVGILAQLGVKVALIVFYMPLCDDSGLGLSCPSDPKLRTAVENNSIEYAKLLGQRSELIKNVFSTDLWYQEAVNYAFAQAKAAWNELRTTADQESRMLKALIQCSGTSTTVQTDVLIAPEPSADLLLSIKVEGECYDIPYLGGSFCTAVTVK